MKMERHENSVIGCASSDSSGESPGGGPTRRRAMGGGIALSRKGKENNLLSAAYVRKVPERGNFTKIKNC